MKYHVDKISKRNGNNLKFFFGLLVDFIGEYDYKNTIKNNIKVRDVYERLLNHSNIKKVQEKPIVLQWLDPSTTKIEDPDLSDPSDLCDKDKTTT